MSWLCSGTCVGSSVPSLADDMKWCFSCSKSSAHHLKLKRLQEWIPKISVALQLVLLSDYLRFPPILAGSLIKHPGQYVPCIHTTILMWGKKNMFVSGFGWWAMWPAPETFALKERTRPGTAMAAKPWENFVGDQSPIKSEILAA